jgi:hypothetical protein
MPTSGHVARPLVVARLLAMAADTRLQGTVLRNALPRGGRGVPRRILCSVRGSANSTVTAPIQKPEWGRFSCYPRTDGSGWICYDPIAPIARRTAAGPFRTLEEADLAACRLSIQADQRGELNTREKKGDRRDWSDPKTWET